MVLDLCHAVKLLLAACQQLVAASMRLAWQLARSVAWPLIALPCRLLMAATQRAMRGIVYAVCAAICGMNGVLSTVLAVFLPFADTFVCRVPGGCKWRGGVQSSAGPALALRPHSPDQLVLTR